MRYGLPREWHVCNAIPWCPYLGLQRISSLISKVFHTLRPPSSSSRSSGYISLCNASETSKALAEGQHSPSLLPGNGHEASMLLPGPSRLCCHWLVQPIRLGKLAQHGTALALGWQWPERVTAPLPWQGAFHTCICTGRITWAKWLAPPSPLLLAEISVEWYRIRCGSGSIAPAMHGHT